MPSGVRSTSRFASSNAFGCPIWKAGFHPSLRHLVDLHGMNDLRHTRIARIHASGTAPAVPSRIWRPSAVCITSRRSNVLALTIMRGFDTELPVRGERRPWRKHGDRLAAGLRCRWKRPRKGHVSIIAGSARWKSRPYALATGRHLAVPINTRSDKIMKYHFYVWSNLLE